MATSCPTDPSMSGDTATKVHRHHAPRSKGVRNPLQAGIQQFLRQRRPVLANDENLVQALPKRYTRYGSLLLLGPTFAVHSAPWHQLYTSLSQDEQHELFSSIASRYPGEHVTHIALNAPIAPVIADVPRPLTSSEGGSLSSNVLRSPCGLVPVYGDFGPETLRNDSGRLPRHRAEPQQADFDAAYWAQTVQLNDIVQVWAPRWTMFSRGNVAEKARLLQDRGQPRPFAGLTGEELGEPLGQIDVVDFYVGIGYFALCYLHRGVKRVWGWELNGWSVEGLRRGCVANGFGVIVVQVDEQGHVDFPDGVRGLVSHVQSVEHTARPVRCIAFWGDNKWAGQVMNDVQRATEGVHALQLNIRHCNLGLLPTCRDSWHNAVRCLSAHASGWVHVHENVSIMDITARGEVVARQLQEIAQRRRADSWTARCVHTEQVKTYAPGVMHCVFDIQLDPNPV